MPDKLAAVTTGRSRSIRQASTKFQRVSLQPQSSVHIFFGCHWHCQCFHINDGRSLGMTLWQQQNELTLADFPARFRKRTPCTGIASGPKRSARPRVSSR